MTKKILILSLWFIIGLAIGFVGGIFLYYSWIFSFIFGFSLVNDRPVLSRSGIRDGSVILSIGSGMLIGGLPIWYACWYVNMPKADAVWAFAVNLITVVLFFLGTIAAYWLDARGSD